MPRMASSPHPASASLRARPELVVAVAFASLTAALVFASLLVGGDLDVGTAAFYGIGPWLFTVVGAVILARMPGHGVGRVALVIGVILSACTLGVELISVFDPRGPVTVVLSGPAGTLLELAVAVVGTLPSLVLFLGSALLVVRFPDGVIQTRAGSISQTLVVVAMGLAAVGAMRDPLFDEFGYSVGLETALQVSGAATFLALGCAYALAILDLTVRYRHADGLRRTQMRWVLAAVAVELCLTVLTFTVSDVIEVLWTLWIASSILPIVAIAIGITRYHLYDIDRLISQTLTYASLSVVLFVAFAVVNLVLQQVIRPITGGNAVATAASTLVVAALFNPARIRIQRAVDRRFHRARYDAEQTVERFAGRLRDQLDLPTLTRELRHTAVDAVEPDGAAVWLRAAGGAR
jgi:hypothetical protein